MADLLELRGDRPFAMTVERAPAGRGRGGPPPAAPGRRARTPGATARGDGVPQPAGDLRRRLLDGGGELVDVRVAPALPGDGDAGVDGAGLDRRGHGREARASPRRPRWRGRAPASRPAAAAARSARPDPAPVRVTNAARAGIQRAHLGRREPGEDRPARRGEVGGQAHADVGDERRASRRALLDHVEHVGALQHDEVGGLPDPVDQTGQRDAGEPGQRLLPGEPVADLPRREPHAPGAVLGVVHDEVLVRHRGEQVVRRRAREAERVGDARGRHRDRLARQQPQHAQRRRRGGHGTAHGAIVSYPRLMRAVGVFRSRRSGWRPMEAWT